MASAFWDDAGLLFYGSVPWGNERRILLIDIATGEIRESVVAPRCRFAGHTARTVVVRVSEGDESSLCALDRATLDELWRCPADPSLVVCPSIGERYLIATESGLRLRCLDAVTGKLVWEFEPPGDELARKPLDRGNRIGTGFPSVAIAGDRVIVTTIEGKVHALSGETGELLAVETPPFRGPYLLTDTAVFFLQAFGLSEFDHREMREVERIEFRSEVEPLYQGNRPTVNAFWLTEESVIWTTMHGALMAVSRRPGPGNRRRTWMEDLGALMPIGVSPLGWGDYLYYSAVTRDHLGFGGLHCYGASALE